VARYPAVMLAGMAAVSTVSIQISPNVSLVRADLCRCAVQQQNLSLQSEDRFVHQLQFSGSVTGKVQ
jgi:hypothetical protein